ncbi:hypothetical protein ACHAQH_009661, partial [Verticillium albo-atrum]
MRFSLLTLTALVLTVTSSVIPVDDDNEHVYEDTFPILRSVLEKRDSFDCKGSSM